MADVLSKPPHIKFRRESGAGLVYDHEHYGYQDATLYEVNERVVDVLEFVGGGRPREEVDREFSPAVVDAVLDHGFLDHGR